MREISGKKRIAVLLAAGVLVGFVNGFFGGGGGMIVVPILIYVLKLPVKKAHATALLIILPMTIASALTYIFTVEVDIVKALVVSVGSVAGGICGAFLLKRASNVFLQALFAAVMIGSGIYMMF